MKILLLIPLLFVACFKPIHAGEIDFKVYQVSRLANDNTFQVGKWDGVQVSYGGDNYVFISNESMDVYTTARAYGTTLTGIGFGFKRKITPNIKMFAQVGYFIVKNDYPRQRGMNEGLLYYLNNMYGRWAVGRQYIPFDEYEVKQDNTFAGEIGLEMNYPISNNFKVGMTASYRAMKIYENIAGYWDEWRDDPNHYWAIDLKRDYSSFNVGVNLNYKF